MAPHDRSISSKRVARPKVPRPNDARIADARRALSEIITARTAADSEFVFGWLRASLIDAGFEPAVAEWAIDDMIRRGALVPLAKLAANRIKSKGLLDENWKAVERVAACATAEVPPNLVTFAWDAKKLERCRRAGDESAIQTMTWQEAAVQLEQMRLQGAVWTSQPAMAEKFGCASSTINRAIERTPSLHAWARARSAFPKARRLNSIPREADSAHVSGSSQDAAIREFIESDTLDPAEKSLFMGLRTIDEQIQYLETRKPASLVMGPHLRRLMKRRRQHRTRQE